MQILRVPNTFPGTAEFGAKSLPNGLYQFSNLDHVIYFYKYYVQSTPDKTKLIFRKRFQSAGLEHMPVKV